ncbi:hypothetical protein EJB05_42627, partial [Eragrostis curvula]
LRRRCETIPPFTAPHNPLCFKRAFLLNDNHSAEAADGISMSNFRVLYLTESDVQIHVGLFTAGSSSWRRTVMNNEAEMRFMGHAAGYMYWHCQDGTVAALDLSTAAEDSSSFALPMPNAHWDPYDPSSIKDITVATGRDGEARIVVACAGEIVRVFARLQGACIEWMLEKSIQISPAMFGLESLQNWVFRRGSDSGLHDRGQVVIVLFIGQNYEHGTWKFTLDIDTLEAERLLNADAYPTKLPWPPTLHACTDHA